MGTNSENHSTAKSNKIRLVDPDEKRINGNGKKKKSLFSKFLLSYSIIIFLIWTSFTLISNIIIQITLIKNNNKRIESSMNNISIILNNTNDKKIISRFLFNQIQADSDIIGVLRQDKSLIINNNKFKQNELVNFSEKDKIINDMNYNTYIYILLKIIKNEYIFKSVNSNNDIIFSGYKPHDLNNNFPLLYLIVSFSISILGFIISLFLATYYLKFIIFLPLKNLLRKTNFTTKGNLTIDFSSNKKDEIGILSNSMHSVTGTLQQLAKKVYMTVIIMTKILRKLYRSSKKVSDSANAQSSTIEQTLGNFANLNSMIKIITEESTRGTKYTSQAFENSKIGMESIRNLEIEMNKIESSSQEITDIIRIINDIAEQTELLSLNASIESARAGEAGRGFNVVAGEVRKLAEKTTQAANRVYDLITNNNSLIRTGVTYTKDATQVLKEIAISNELSASVVKTISEEIQKVKQSSNEILGVINYISEVTQANLIESDHVSDTTSDLSYQAINLQKLIEKFDFRDEKTRKNIHNIKKLLKNKLVIVNDFLRQYGTGLLPTGNTLSIKTEEKDYSVREMKFGEVILTNNMDFVDKISKKTNTFVTFFQRFEEKFISTATTIRYYDNTRSVGKFIKPGTDIYKKIIKGETYYGRIFIVNRWYIAVYRPIVDKTGYVQAVISIGLPEETSIDLKIEIENDNYKDGIIMDQSFKHNY